MKLSLSSIPFSFLKCFALPEVDIRDINCRHGEGFGLCKICLKEENRSPGDTSMYPKLRKKEAGQ
jgi:hypothetical protein